SARCAGRSRAIRRPRPTSRPCTASATASRARARAGVDSALTARRARGDKLPRVRQSNATKEEATHPIARPRKRTMLLIIIARLLLALAAFQDLGPLMWTGKKTGDASDATPTEKDAAKWASELRRQSEA